MPYSMPDVWRISLHVEQDLDLKLRRAPPNGAYPHLAPYSGNPGPLDPSEPTSLCPDAIVWKDCPPGLVTLRNVVYELREVVSIG